MIEALPRVSTWQYDGVGNRTRQQVGSGVTPYSYASGHITQDQQVQYHYDARERLVCASHP